MGLIEKFFGSNNQEPSVSNRVREILAGMNEGDNAQALEAFGGLENLEKTLQSINEIDSTAGNVNDHLFTRKYGESGEDAAARFLKMASHWDEGHRPSLPAITEAWMDRLGIHKDTTYRKFLPLIAARAEMVKGQPAEGVEATDDEPAYHSRVHTLHVLQNVCYLIEAHQEIVLSDSEINDTFLQKPLSEEDIATLMAAALSHDIDHPGRGNKDPETGEYRLFYNEDASVAVVEPLIESVGGLSLSSELMPILQQTVRYTDPGQPRSDLIAIVDAYRNRQKPPRNGYAEYYDVHSIAIATILSDADLLLSGGMGEQGLQENSAKLTEEAKEAGLNMDFNSAASNKFFFDNILGDSYLSGAGRMVFNPVYHELRDTIEQRLEAA